MTQGGHWERSIYYKFSWMLFNSVPGNWAVWPERISGAPGRRGPSGALALAKGRWVWYGSISSLGAVNALRGQGRNGPME